MTDVAREVPISTWLQEGRKARGFSQTELGELMRVAQQTVSNWERGKGQPDEVQLQFLVDLLEAQPPEANAGWGGEHPLDAVLVRTDQRSVLDVVRRINNDRYVLNPEFQRDFVWPEEKQSRLIESCLMRIPLPVLYVAEAPDGRIVVVDGLQRLNTFRRFLGGEFALTFGSPDDEKKHPLQGKRFEDLELKYRERIEDTSLVIYILDAKAPERAKLDIFERVNSGVPLTRQQMRNCLYSGPATRWLKAAAESDPFTKVTGGALNPKEMRDREALNRFCAFKLLGWKSYRTGDIDAFLADGLARMNKLKPQELEQLREDFDRAVRSSAHLFGQHAFRKSLAGPSDGGRSPFNIALFEVSTLALSTVDESLVRARAENIRQAFRDLLADKEFDRAITYATNSRNRVEMRFRLAEESVGRVLA
jgi:transcriptional regulator with XRE-family HTH domain